jgi:chromosome segregation ATPase
MPRFARSCRKSGGSLITDGKELARRSDTGAKISNMPSREEVLAEAEAEIRRATDALDAVESDLEDAERRSEEIENEPWNTPEEAAEIGARVDVIQRDIVRLQTEVSEANDERRSAIETWEHYDRESGDDPDDEDHDS